MKRKRKSLHVLERNGMWWKGGEWHTEPIEGSSSVRRVKTLKKLKREFAKIAAPVTANSLYYKQTRYGNGWYLKYSAEKKDEELSGDQS